MIVDIIRSVYRITDMKKTRRAILAYLAIFAKSDGTGIRPGQELMSQQLKMCERTIRTHLAGLIEEGYLAEDGYFGHTKCYKIILEKLPSMGVRTILEKTEAAAPPATNGNGHKPGDQPPLPAADQPTGKRAVLVALLTRCDEEIAAGGPLAGVWQAKKEDTQQRLDRLERSLPNEYAAR